MLCKQLAEAEPNYRLARGGSAADIRSRNGFCDRVVQREEDLWALVCKESSWLGPRKWDVCWTGEPVAREGSVKHHSLPVHSIHPNRVNAESA